MNYLTDGKVEHELIEIKSNDEARKGVRYASLGCDNWVLICAFLVFVQAALNCSIPLSNTLRDFFLSKFLADRRSGHLFSEHL